MINLARRDIANHLGRYILTGFGLGLLIGVTLTMAGVYRGMVDDAKVLLGAVGADIWVVQQHTLGPFAEPSSLQDDVARSLEGLPGVARTGNVAYLTMQVTHAGKDQRVMIAGYTPGRLGGPAFLIDGRPISRAHYEAVADVRTGFEVGDRLRLRRTDYTVVGLTKRMVSSGGDPMVFLSLKDAQETQFRKDNEAIINDRERLAANPSVNKPGQPGLLPVVEELQTESHRVNAVLVRVETGQDPRRIADTIKRWKHLTAYTNKEMEDILIAKLIATAARQIALFLIILAVVSAAIVAFIIYTMTLGKLKELAVLKLIGTRDRTIAAMILQEALGLGFIGFFVGKFAATLWAPVFPKHVLLLTDDALRAFGITLAICALASVLAIRAALRIDPAEAIGG
ncbi:MAG: ABC transporter permease [Deltaproteobacteria bacterium RIFOXYA12_FULL_61_11]|nr:MAG: ABC transporter permease [Deltaproteobacteria bacterium RIFOXYA12_FULL_61_11]